MSDSKPTEQNVVKSRLVKEEVPRSQRENTVRPRRRRRTRRVLFRGSLLEGLYQATLEGFVAAADTFQGTVNNFVDRDREDRDRRGGRLGNIVSNLVDAGWDAYDGIVDIPRRSWESYRNEIDSEDDREDDADEAKAPRA